MTRFGLGLSTRTRHIIAFALAIVLPLIAADVNSHFAILRYAPFALYFLCVGIVAAVGGLAPSLLAVALSIFIRSYLIMRHHQNHWSFHASDFAGTFILCLEAIIISLFIEGRYKASEALRDRTEALINSLHSGRCASWLLDVDRDQNLHWYDGSYPVFGRPFAELEFAGSIMPFLHPDDRTTVQDILQHMKSSLEPLVKDFRVLWPGGEVHWLETRGTRTPGTRNLWRGITVDITDRKLAEAALLRAEKLAAMGRMASTVAHEINNPLEAVTNLLYLVRSDTTINESSRAFLDTAEMELSRLGHITRLTLGFVRTSEKPCTIELSQAVEDVLAIFRSRSEMKKIYIHRDYQPNVFVSLQPHELRQIITNLASNSIDALSSPGAQVAIKIHTEENLAVLHFEDNGSGIGEAHITRVFEPFFTTKEDVGTGIGLWVTRELVHKNSGRITVQSGDLANGMKTSFRLEFPIAGSDNISALVLAKPERDE
jgi:signal transduction histidine kinase